MLPPFLKGYGVLAVGEPAEKLGPSRIAFVAYFKFGFGFLVNLRVGDDVVTNVDLRDSVVD